MADLFSSEDDVLAYTQAKRKEMVENLMVADENGNLIPPQDPKDRTHFLMALDGMDRASLTKLRIKVDKDIGDKQAEAAGMLADMLRDPRATRIGTGQRDEAPVLDHDIAPTRVLPGELTTGSQPDTYDAFMSRQTIPGLAAQAPVPGAEA